MDFISETCTNFKLQSDYNLVYQCQNVNITVFVVGTTMRMEEKAQTFFDKVCGTDETDFAIVCLNEPTSENSNKVYAFKKSECLAME